MGENLANAALREAREETGLTFAHPLLSLGLEHHFNGRWGPAEEFAFALEASVTESVTIDPSEHQDWRWTNVQVAHAQLPYLFQKDSLKALGTLLGSKV